MKSIRIKILLPVIIMLLVFVSFMGIQITGITENLKQIQTMNDKHYATLSNSKDLKLQVVQVQQFLTDISATRALDGLDDGFEEAEEHAGEFKSIMEKLLSINPEDKAILEQINNDFNTYYETGKDMANLYIEGGPEKGNTLMGDFDFEAERINGEVDEYVSGAEEIIIEAINDVEKLIKRSIRLSIMSIIVAVIISILTWTFATKKIYNPINTLVQHFEELSSAGGDLTKTIEIETGDEIELLANAVSTFIANVRGIVVQVKDTGENVASLAELLNVSIDENQSVLEEVNTAIESIATGASDQARYVNEISYGIQDISTDVNENEIKVSNINDSAGETRRLINHGLEAVNNQNIKTDENIEAFGKVSIAVEKLAREIGDVESILSTIAGISEQTNLLALNAAIEAARAGEHGRGFSVVADEVRSLAEESAVSTQEIAQILQNINKDAKEAVEEIKNASVISQEQKIAIDDTNVTFNNISQEIEAMIDSIGEINTSFRTIGDNTNSISEKIQEVSSVSEGNAAISQEVSASSEEQNAAMQEIGATSHELNELSIRLEDIISTFKI